jgi:hypothetical protein
VEFFCIRKVILFESNPNTKISDEQYALLVSEFGKPSPAGGRNVLLLSVLLKKCISPKKKFQMSLKQNSGGV